MVFPLNIGPLTYSRPSGYAGVITPGTLVRAEVKRTLQHGVVLGETPGYTGHRTKEIVDIVSEGPLFSKAMLKLLAWMADYYISSEGLVLKSMLPTEVFEKPGSAKQTTLVDSSNYAWQPCPVDRAILSPVSESIFKGQYKAYLLHSPTLRHEISCIHEIIKEISNVILLAPEISVVEEVAAVLHGIAGERLAVLHGQLSRGRKRAAFDRILSGTADIVLGTRPAVFAPLKSLSLIAVLQEQNRSYKNLEGLRYHARDVAVMRGYLDRTPVLLSSTAPSAESFHNTLRGKYVLLRPDLQIRRPRIDVINMRTARKATPYISRQALDTASSHIKKGGSVLFLINRKGYSMIQCPECGDVPSCPECRIPLIYHKDARTLKCHYCGHASDAPDSCRKCGSANLEMVGAGTQRVAADLKKLLGTEPLRIDKDALSNDRLLKVLPGPSAERIVVGTKAVTGRFRSKGEYNLCVLLNPDIGLHLPDFRSAEALFQEILGLAECTSPGGLVLVQTRMPENSVYRNVRRYNSIDFLKEELSVRKTLAYPPFSRMIGITVSSNTDIGRASEEAMACFDREIEVIGPSSSTRKGIYIWKVLLKSPVRVKLNACAKDFLKRFKYKKGMRTVIDVDPISL